MKMDLCEPRGNLDLKTIIHAVNMKLKTAPADDCRGLNALQLVRSLISKFSCLDRYVPQEIPVCYLESDPEEPQRWNDHFVICGEMDDMPVDIVVYENCIMCMPCNPVTYEAIHEDRWCIHKTDNKMLYPAYCTNGYRDFIDKIWRG